MEHFFILIKSLALFALLLFSSSCQITAYKKTKGLKANIIAQNAGQRVLGWPLSVNDRKRLAQVAQNAVGKPRLIWGNLSFRGDCSGTVRAIFSKAHIPLGGIIKTRRDNDVKIIYRWIKKYGEIFTTNPEVGDLIFFHNTYDRTRNGHMDDPLTHIGVVEKVEGSTIHFVHHLGHSIIRSRMDLSFPKMVFHPQNGHRINHILRRAQGGYKAYTAAELFAGFGRPVKVQATLTSGESLSHKYP